MNERGMLDVLTHIPRPNTKNHQYPGSITNEPMDMALDHSNQNTWGLRGVGFSLSEMAAATTVGRICGSIINRPQYTSLFDAVQSKFNITMHSLPIWLQEVDFVRSAVILGESMRRIPVPNTMGDVDKLKLSGLATLVVLCSQYSEDVAGTTQMLNLLLVGELGTVVHVLDGENNKPSLPYGFRTHLTTFIASCLDADRNSDVHCRAVKWMAELHAFGDVSINSENDTYSGRRRQASIDLMAELLGAPSAEETMHKNVRQVFSPLSDTIQTPDMWAKTHDTLYLSSAYIALAAAANGASVVVECISSSGSIFLPNPVVDPKARRATFLVRLWLVQPPEHVRGILRFSTSEAQDAGGRDLEGPPLVIFGGALEIALAIARRVGFRGEIGPETAAGDEHLEKLALWTRAVECAKGFRWSAQAPTTSWEGRYQYMATFSLIIPDETDVFPPEALPLHKSLVQGDSGLRPIAKTVARLVHGYYQFSNYHAVAEEDPDHQPGEDWRHWYDGGGSQLDNAMHFVLLAMAIQVLQNTVSSVGDSPDSYALSTGAIRCSFASRGLLQDILVSGPSQRGLTSLQLLQAAASVWGGFRHPSASTSTSSDELGIAAPHCCVIFDGIRDPLDLARRAHPANGHLLSIWRGALPMLPRDPGTNFIRGYPGTSTTEKYPHRPGGAGSRSHQSLYKTLHHDYTPKHHSLPGNKPPGNMVITFEPSHQDPTRAVFCAWFGGHFLSELDPADVLAVLLCAPRSPFQVLPRHRIEFHEGREEEIRVIDLYKKDLLSLSRFTSLGSHIIAVIRGMDDPAWLVYAVGCCHPLGSAVHVVVHDCSTHGGFEMSEYEDQIRGRVGFVIEMKSSGTMP